MRIQGNNRKLINNIQLTVIRLTQNMELDLTKILKFQIIITNQCKRKNNQRTLLNAIKAKNMQNIRLKNY